MEHAVSEMGEAGARQPAGIWEPVQLRYLGRVGELMRMTSSGSRRDAAQGCGQTRRLVGGTGQLCGY